MPAATPAAPAPAAAPASNSPSGEPEVEISTVDASAGVSDTASSPTIQNYEVQSGDTLLSIALANNVTTDRLRELNFLQSDLIQAGQILQVPMVPPTPTPEPVPFYHEVKAGESLGGIAAQYGVSWADLTLANKLEDANALQVGMKLIIPDYSPEAASGEGSAASGDESASVSADASGNAVHRVKAGETLSQIAQMYGVTTAQIVAANNLTSRNVIKTNQDLIIPGVSPQAAQDARSVKHTVAVGETLSQIAKQYGVATSAIVKANGMPNPDSVYVGQVLVIPVEEAQQ